MSKKPLIQKAILKNLSKKRATPIKVLIEDVKNSINKNTDENKVNYAIARSINNLLENGLVECFNSDNNRYLRVTKEGKSKLNNIILESDASLVSTKWDGFWRIILLDLPEERKKERDALRYILKKAGFKCVKNSVWISMYPFEHLFTNIKKDLKLSSELRIIVTDKIDEKTEEEFLSICEIKY